MRFAISHPSSTLSDFIQSIDYTTSSIPPPVSPSPIATIDRFSHHDTLSSTSSQFKTRRSSNATTADTPPLYDPQNFPPPSSQLFPLYPEMTTRTLDAISLVPSSRRGCSLQSLPPQQLDNAVFDDDEDDTPECIDTQQQRSINFCSDFTDFKVGECPEKFGIFKNLNPISFHGSAHDVVEDLTEDEFVPSPFLASSSPVKHSDTLRMMTLNEGSQFSSYEKLTQSPMSRHTATLRPRGSFSQEEQTTGVSTALSSDWFHPAPTNSCLSPEHQDHLQHHQSPRHHTQAMIMEMRGLQLELQRSFGAQTEDHPSLTNSGNCDAENFLLEQQSPGFVKVKAGLDLQQPSYMQDQSSSVWARHSQAATLEGPFSTSQAAAAALSRLPPLEFSRTVSRCKELVVPAIAKLEAAYASAHGVRDVDRIRLNSHLIQLLSNAVEGMASAVTVVAPGYLDSKTKRCNKEMHGLFMDVIAEERCNTTKRSMMLAHPDEFKNPSSFLKIYGDPQCRAGSPSHPRKGRDGNWECSKCQNVNYPRRFRCNNTKCKALRDVDGDKLVSDYARQVFHLYLAQSKVKGVPSLSRHLPMVQPLSPVGQSSPIGSAMISQREFEDNHNCYEQRYAHQVQHPLREVSRSPNHLSQYNMIDDLHNISHNNSTSFSHNNNVSSHNPLNFHLESPRNTVHRSPMNPRSAADDKSQEDQISHFFSQLT